MTRGSPRPRFAREARVQGQLEHPAVVPVYDLLGTIGYMAPEQARGKLRASYTSADLQVRLQAWQLHQLVKDSAAQAMPPAGSSK